MNVAVLPLCCLVFTLCAHAQSVVREWSPSELAKWSGSHITNKHVQDGALLFHATADDAMLVSPVFPAFPVTPSDRIEVTMQSAAGGDCEVYWTGTTDGNFGGFTAEKRTPFVAEQNGWRTYTLEPFWHAEKRIIKLRLDFPHDRAGQYAIRSVRVVRASNAAPATLPARNLALDAQGEWRGRVSAPVPDFAFVSLRMAANSGASGLISFAVTDRNGLITVRFPLRADGRMHTYNIDVSDAPGGKNRTGEVIELRLRPSDAANANARVEWIAAGSDVSGPADLEVTYLGLKNPFARSGRPERLEAVIRNHGSEPARGVRPQLKLSGARVLESAPAQDVEFGEVTTCAWTIQADQPGDVALTVTLEGATPVTRTVSFKPPAAMAKAPYVPVPTPAKTEYQVGAYYFPGWNTAAAWSRLDGYPERQPVLGRYREGDPEVADWHIKWAVEHGISFFAYDWYWDRGHRHLEHGLSALFQARYQHLMQFCLLYANHNSPGSHSAADFEAMTRYWIGNYFQRTNYLRIDGRPVIVMFAPMNPAKDMGIAAVRQSFDRMRAMCREAGVGGIYFVACMAPSPGMLGSLKEMGYDAVSAYNWPGLNMTDAERQANRAPFATAADGYARAWDAIAASNTLKLIPPVFGGWDARPWHGEGTLARTARTPEAFENHLLSCKRFLDAQEQAPRLKMLLVEAWNEWGEGSYIEPHREFGFGYLEAVRKVFAPASHAPQTLSPADLGLGPYDIPAAAPVSSWDFIQATNALGWSGNVLNLRTESGALRFTTRGGDPILSSPPLRARATKFPFIILRLKASRDIEGQLFWVRRGEALSEPASIRFPVKGDGAFHEVKLRVADNPRWRGIISSLRFDPGSHDGVDVSLQHIGFATD